MDGPLKFFMVMMALMTTGLVGYAGITAIDAFRRRLSRNTPPPGLDPDEVELVRAQLAETEQLRARVAELEERLDFTERMLGQSADRSIGPGQR